MARHNIYVRKENEELWQRSTKSDWINAKLDKWRTATQKIDPPQPAVVVNTPDEVKQVVAPRGLRFCKIGHPIPDGRSKCLGKGCKYS